MREPGLVVGYNRLGDALLDSCDEPGAAQAYRKSLEAAQSLGGSDKFAEENVAVADEKMGDIYKNEGNNDEALKWYVRSRDRRELLSSQYGDFQRELAVSLAKMADALPDRTSEARDLYVRSQQIAEKLLVTAPQRTDFRRDVAVARLERGDLLRALDRKSEALELYSDALQTFRALANSDPDKDTWQHDYMTAIGRVAEVDMLEGEYSKAEALYREIISTAVRLADKSPNCVERKHDVAVIYQKLGEALRAQNSSESLAFYQQSLNIRRALARERLTNQKWALELSQNYILISEYYLPNNTSEALRVAQEHERFAREIHFGRDPIKTLARALSNVTWYAVFACEFDIALSSAEEAIKLAPEAMQFSSEFEFIRENYAHALMFSGQSDKARSEYLGYEAKPVDIRDNWRTSILTDFNLFRKANLTSALMDEIQTVFGQPAPASAN